MMKTILEQLMEKVSITPNGCWEWQSSNWRGYGYLLVGRKHSRAHRVAYELLVGLVPEGLELDHLCRNTLCVNPAHLEPVTHQENCKRGDAGKYEHKHKLREVCKYGHPLVEDNVYVYPKSGIRRCLTCKKQTQREYKQRIGARR